MHLRTGKCQVTNKRDRSNDDNSHGNDSDGASHLGGNVHDGKESLDSDEEARPRKKAHLDTVDSDLEDIIEEEAKEAQEETKQAEEDMQDDSSFGLGVLWTSEYEDGSNHEEGKEEEVEEADEDDDLTKQAYKRHEEESSGNESDGALGFDPYADPTDDEEESEKFGQEDNKKAPSRQAMKEFKAYVRDTYQNSKPLTTKEACAIRIMFTLFKKRATLDTYDAVMEWHLKESGFLNEGQTLGKSKHFISRKVLMARLKKRYDMRKKYAHPVARILPHSKSKVQVYRRHARDLVQSLLADPRWCDEDWLFFPNAKGELDPFAPPPENVTHIEDINTGLAFRETYKALITKRNQVLVALPLYIDGAVTGQFDKLQVTALKMTIGILNKKARNREHAWKTLGLVCNYTKEDSRGKKLLVESGHLAALDMREMQEANEEEGTYTGKEEDPDKAADYHFILAELMESLNELTQEGMVWDLQYKGKLYKNCELVFFVPFVKCDGDEGDKLCLHYRSRGKGVKQLCRFCTCPNEDTDNPLAKYSHKTEPMLKKLYEQQNFERLRNLSQICAKNAFHGLRFGLHNDRGIHGATPTELLHAILLGIFKYARDCFFAQIGKDSLPAEEINALAVQIGKLLARQSDRNRPRTKFGKGIQKGKLMAKEFVGVLLVISVLLRMQASIDILTKARKKSFREPWQRTDWRILIETLIQWEAYLSMEQMDVKLVHRLKEKHRYVMFLLKKIANRTKKMGFRVMKFHAIVHIAEDIMSFGVPSVVDTETNESHHKTTKVAAQLTQKDIATFEKQVSERLDDMHVLALAMEELSGRPLWQYFDGYDHDSVAEAPDVIKTSGMRFVVLHKEGDPGPSFQIQTRMQNRNKIQMDQTLIEMLWHLQQLVKEFVPSMPIHAEHHRKGCVFRSHPNYRGKGPWRDWAMIRWEEGDFPAKIWGFVDLTTMPEGDSVEVDEYTTLTNNIYAIVESTHYIQEEKPMSDIWSPIRVDTDRSDGELRRVYLLVDVETIVKPICVIPNIGARTNPDAKDPKKWKPDPDEFLLMTPRDEWAGQFEDWVKASHKLDKDQMEETEPETETEGDGEEEEEDEEEDEDSDEDSDEEEDEEEETDGEEED